MTAALMFRPVEPAPLCARYGAPSRAAVLTALTAAAMEAGNLKAVLTLTRTGRPASLVSAGGGFRWMAVEALSRLYPDTAREVLVQAVGLGGRRGVALTTAARAAGLDPATAVRMAQQIADNEDAVLTARWIWPTACEVAAAHTGAEPEDVRTVTGSRGCGRRPQRQARKLAVYLTMTEGDVNPTAMAAATGLDKKTVKHHAADLSDRRDDDPRLDETLEQLAARLRVRLDEELSAW